MSINKYNLQNNENYNSTFDFTQAQVCIKYMSLINDYLKQCFDNIQIHNEEYKNYIIKKGIYTISYIFKFLLIYTKNLDVIVYNCQKSSVYYIEFIGQICDDNNSFLQLNAKDASLFIYKKTIFEITNNYRNNLDLMSDNFVNNIDYFINIYNNNLLLFLDNYNSIDIIKIINTDLICFANKIIKLFIENNDNLLKNKLMALLSFSKIFKNINNYIQTNEIFLKKIKKFVKLINIDYLEFILLNNKYDNTSHIKYVNSIITKIYNSI